MQTFRVPALRNRSGQVRTNIGSDLTRCWAERRPARERGKPLVQRHRRPVLSTLTTSPNAYSALGAADPVSHPTHARLDFRHVLPSRRRWPAQGRPPHGAPGSPGRIRARPRHAADAPLVPRNPNAASPGPPQSRSAQWRTQPPAIALSSSPLRIWARGPRARGPSSQSTRRAKPEGRHRAPSSCLEERRHTALLQCLTKPAS